MSRIKSIRDAVASTAAMGDADIVIREPNQLWIDPMGSGAVVPDLAWKRDGTTYALAPSPSSSAPS